MTMRWLGVMGMLLLCCSVSSSGCARKPIILRDSEQVWFPKVGDVVEREGLICMDKGNASAVFGEAADEVLTHD